MHVFCILHILRTGSIVQKNIGHGSLKLVSAIFYPIFIFLPNDSLSETIKNFFCFIEKALFIHEIFKFL